MRKAPLNLYIEPIAHIIFWLGLFVLLQNSDSSMKVVEQYGSGNKRQIDAHHWLVYLMSAMIFYFNILVLYPLFFKQRKYLHYVLGLIAAFMVIAIVEYYYFRPGIMVIELLFKQYTTINFVFLLFSVVYVFAKDFILTESKQKKIIQEQTVNELIFLKSQLNPHFLFNTINNIYSVAQKNQDPEVAKYLADLTKVLRYSLYESNQPMVSLEKELFFLKSYINMSMLKFDSNVLKIDYEMVGETSNFKIAPLILIPIVENAFKHNSMNHEDPFIKIKIDIDDKNCLKLVVENSCYPQNQETQLKKIGGIGIKNLKRRLELLYHKKHEFSIERSERSFKSTLKLELNE
ncbi:sensor histidine kinase [Flagellimonas nanhaiensis]|uniref:Signal transduction histidine kinase internal region domain-containing protein n=1 Tax=Flagellimonas nanhaiensis TaxID=2292706 RepID=A0A371JS14_9FLAO|nr:histidine kinase [Allomuricauda nanhaiensis]RDY60614.1 hypothetical protein DX873_00060 [Allomuricauda nanhaiensis]